MRIALVVDGVSEYSALPALFPQLKRITGHTLIGPLHADIQPYADVPLIAHRVRKVGRQAVARRAEHVIVLLDREGRDECPGRLAKALTTELRTDLDGKVSVVVKNRTFENWLLADLDAMGNSPNRFRVSKKTARAVAPDKADRPHPAARLVNRCVVDDEYDKVADSKRILRAAEVDRMALNSRSFRRFLRAVGHPRFADQSRLPRPA